jgi:hypothetical protein
MMKHGALMFFTFWSSLSWAEDGFTFDPAKPAGRAGQLTTVIVKLDGKPAASDLFTVAVTKPEGTMAGDVRTEKKERGEVILQAPISIPDGVAWLNYSIFGVPGSRDTYRIGVGIDLMSFVKSFRK